MSNSLKNSTEKNKHLTPQRPGLQWMSVLEGEEKEKGHGKSAVQLQCEPVTRFEHFQSSKHKLYQTQRADPRVEPSGAVLNLRVKGFKFRRQLLQRVLVHAKAEGGTIPGAGLVKFHKGRFRNGTKRKTVLTYNNDLGCLLENRNSLFI